MSQRKSRGARQGTRFYRGRTTHTSSEQKQLRKQKEYRRQKLSKQNRQLFIDNLRSKLRWVIAFLVVVTIFNLAQIKSHSYVGLTGLTDGDKQVITDLTTRYITGFKKFKAFFNDADYEAYILENASFVSRVEASSHALSTSLKVRIVPKTPVHAYRGTDNSSAQWIAQDGSLITLTEAQISDMGSSVPETVIVDTSGVNYREGDSILPISTLDFINQLNLSLALVDEEISEVEIGAIPRELSLSLVGEKYKLLVSVTRSVESTTIDFQKAKDQLAKTNTVPAQYIDLRVVDKVFYR